MKKLAILLLTLGLALSMAIPAMAQPNVTTQVEVTAGGGAPPIVMCKWETPDDGDPSHAIPATQILPPVSYNGVKPVGYYAVVTDPQGIGTIQAVYADVYHPDGPPEFGSHKYQIQLLPVATKVIGLADFDAAVAQNLIFFGEGQTAEIVRHQLDQQLAWLYEVQGEIHYCQPAGIYTVKVHAEDRNNNWSSFFCNTFEYVGVTAAEFDFTTVNYGSVEVCVNKWVGGNTTFSNGDGLPTVRNIGNTNLKVAIFQDDMAFDKTLDVWNVEYDMRLGADGTNVVYSPAFKKGQSVSQPTVTIDPDVLNLCNTQKVDFSIHVKKAPAGQYSGVMTIGAVFAPFSAP